MEMLKRILTCIAAIAFIALANPAMAQKTGPNGGMISGKDGEETELVVSPTALTVYVIEKGKVQPAKGIALRAVVQEGGKNVTVPLKAEGDKLMGPLAAPLGKGAIVVVSGKDDHGHAINARFVIP